LSLATSYLPAKIIPIARLISTNPATFQARRSCQPLKSEVVLSRSALSRCIDRMAASGLVEKLDCPEDPRGLIVRITPKASKSLSKRGQSIEDWLRLCLAGTLARMSWNFSLTASAAWPSSWPAKKPKPRREDLAQRSRNRSRPVTGDWCVVAATSVQWVQREGDETEPRPAYRTKYRIVRYNPLNRHSRLE